MASGSDDVTRRFPDHGFLLTFNTCFVSVMYRSQIGIFQWSIMADYGVQPLGGILDRKQCHRSIAQPRFAISVQNTFII